MKAIAIIPARIRSTRFPGKALALLAGKPIIHWVWEAVQQSGLFGEVIVATDSSLIFDAVQGFGGKAMLTRADHPSGTDRIAEVAATMEADVIVNVQGDEPLIDKSSLFRLLDAFSDPTVRIASLMTAEHSDDDIHDPNLVKVVVDYLGNALYFSRSVIPFDRDMTGYSHFWRHIGVYAYRRETLMHFVTLPPGDLEQVEKLEQLRALENGIPIRMVSTDYQGMGVDTLEDLHKLEVILRERT